MTLKIFIQRSIDDNVLLAKNWLYNNSSENQQKELDNQNYRFFKIIFFKNMTYHWLLLHENKYRKLYYYQNMLL